MSSDVSLYVLYRIANATIQPFPFPHIFVREVFPPEFYRRLREQLPPKESLTTLRALRRVKAGYPETRLVLPLTRKDLEAVAEPLRSFWGELAEWMLRGGLGEVMLSKFGDYLTQRFGDVRGRQFQDEAMLVQDYTTYALGPHTDDPRKVLSFLFYLPADDTRSHLGTSIYIPKDRKFTCAGGPYHAFELFQRVCTMPYVANSLFAFLKTPYSFHGVEPITETEVRRDLLLYDIKVQAPPEIDQHAPAAPVETAVPSKFSF